MSPQIPVFAELIAREIKRRNCSEADFAAICRLPVPRLQQILEADISPTASEVGLIAPWIAKDEAGTTFWTAEEMIGLVP